MLVSKYYLWFVILSCMGWIYECIYYFFTTGTWVNRGFLYGPLCPIYGFGAIIIILLFKAGRSVWGIRFSTLEIFLISVIGSAVLEYSTSWIMEKLFHASWWDYSNMPLNLNGRICLPAALLFGIFGIVIIKKIMPVLDMISSKIPDSLIELLTIAAVAILTADFTLTISRYYF